MRLHRRPTPPAARSGSATPPRGSSGPTGSRACRRPRGRTRRYAATNASSCAGRDLDDRDLDHHGGICRVRVAGPARHGEIPRCGRSSPRVRSSTAPARRRPPRTSWSRTAGSSTSAPAWTATRWSTAPAPPCCPGWSTATCTCSSAASTRSRRCRPRSRTRTSRRSATCGPPWTAGITTVRDAGGADLGVKEAVADGLVPGPRMQIAVSMLSQTGGHGDGWYPSGCSVPLVQPHPGRPHTVVDGPEEVRRMVRELVRAGADVIKVATSGGVLSARDDPRHGHFRDEEVAMMVAEATAAGHLRDGARPGHRRHQGRGTQRGPVHRARHLPRRRGDRADARLGHLAGADAVRAAGGARPGGGRGAVPGRGAGQGADGAGGARRVGPAGDRGRRDDRDGHRLRRRRRTGTTCASWRCWPTAG